MSTNEIYTYFQSSYKVEWVAIHLGPKYRFAIVTFRDEENAKKASQQKLHTIAGSILTVSTADSIQERPSLLALNDDCILEIFKNLELKDLCSASNTCSRIRGLAQMEFASRYKDKTFTLLENDEKVADYLRNFGSQIHSIELKRPMEIPSHTVLGDTYILHLLAEYCGSLSKLKLFSYEFYHRRDSTTTQLIPLFSRLKKLTVKRCHISDKILSMFDVTKLILNEVTILKDDAEVRCFTNLKTLNIIRGERRSHTHFLRLVSRSKSVVNLEIDLLYAFEILEPEISYIYQEISRFKNLKAIKVYDRDWSNQSIESQIEMVSRLRHLSSFILAYRADFTDENLVNLIRNGNNLKRLIIVFNDSEYSDHPYNPNQFQAMNNIVSQRANGRPLEVIIVGSENQIRRFTVAHAQPPEALLKIKCLLKSKVGSTLRLQYGANSYPIITMTDKQIQILRNHGLDI